MGVGGCGAGAGWDGQNAAQDGSAQSVRPFPSLSIWSPHVDQLFSWKVGPGCRGGIIGGGGGGRISGTGRGGINSWNLASIACLFSSERDWKEFVVSLRKTSGPYNISFGYALSNSYVLSFFNTSSSSCEFVRVASLLINVLTAGLRVI